MCPRRHNGPAGGKLEFSGRELLLWALAIVLAVTSFLARRSMIGTWSNGQVIGDEEGG